MNNKFDELTKSLAQSVTRRAALKRFGVGLAGMALACFAMTSVALAQTSVVCDPAGDAHYGSNGKGGPNLPGWFDITQSSINDSGDNIIFTLSLSIPLPMVPVWENADDGGQFWWGYRLVGGAVNIDYISSDCIASKPNSVPACYTLDLIWSVQNGGFHARLLDDTSCTESDIPFSFSADRTQVSFLVSKALFTNAALIPDPNALQYSAITLLWKANSINNMSVQHIDAAPDQPGTWFSSSNTAYGCP